MIDMFVDEPFSFEVIYKNRVKAKVENVTVPVLAIDYLVKLKIEANRPKDLDDIVQLKAIKKIQERKRVDKK